MEKFTTSVRATGHAHNAYQVIRPDGRIMVECVYPEDADAIARGLNSAPDRNKKVSNTEKPGECRACVQGYTREGMAAYPDHVALCPLHSAAADLLRRAAEALNESWGEGGNNGAHPLAEEINTALGAS